MTYKQFTVVGIFNTAIGLQSGKIRPLAPFDSRGFCNIFGSSLKCKGSAHSKNGYSFLTSSETSVFACAASSTTFFSNPHSVT